MNNNISPIPGFDDIRCSCCGETLGVVPHFSWRLNGTEWEHQCGDPQAGYFPSRNFSERLTETAWLRRVMKQINPIDIDRFFGIIVKEGDKQ